MVSQLEGFSGGEGDDGIATELEEIIKSDNTTSDISLLQQGASSPKAWRYFTQQKKVHPMKEV